MGQHTGCSETTFWLLEGAAGLMGCMVTVLAFHVASVAVSLVGVDLKKLKLNMVVQCRGNEEVVKGVCSM